MQWTSSIGHLLLFLLCCSGVSYLSCCHVGSDKLKAFTRRQVEKTLESKQLKSVYWNDEPLDPNKLAKVTGMNITLVEAKLKLDDDNNTDSNTSLVRDFFVTCSADRDRGYSLALNLEITNPFNEISVNYQRPVANIPIQPGVFRIRLPQSSFLVQLNQKISYDECLEVKYVQLAPNISYEIDCDNCSGSENSPEQEYLDTMLAKRMNQVDAELDSLLSEKLLLGLQTLFNQERLDLDLYLKN